MLYFPEHPNYSLTHSLASVFCNDPCILQYQDEAQLTQALLALHYGSNSYCKCPFAECCVVNIDPVKCSYRCQTFSSLETFPLDMTDDVT